MADTGYIVALAVVGVLALAVGGVAYTAYSHGGGVPGFGGMGGMGAMGGMGSGMGPGMEGMMGGDHDEFEGMGGHMGMGGMCPYMDEDMMEEMEEMMGHGMMGGMMGEEMFDNVVQVYATITGVEGRIVTLQAGNDTITAFVAGMYVDQSNGYLVHGSWLLNALEENIGADVSLTLAGHDGKYIVAGVEVDGRSLLVPMLAGWG